MIAILNWDFSGCKIITNWPMVCKVCWGESVARKRSLKTRFHIFLMCDLLIYDAKSKCRVVECFVHTNELCASRKMCERFIMWR